MTRSYVVPVLWLTLGFAGGASAQSPFNRNLIVNGGAEAGPAVGSWEETAVAIPSWTTTGGITAGKYGTDAFLAADSYGPRDRGSNHFIVNSDLGNATATQTVDLSAAGADIDAGRVRFHLSAYVGGIYTVTGRLKATFLDGSSKVLLEAVADAPAEADFMGDGGLLHRTASGFLLPATRTVRIVFELGRSGPGYGYPAADNLSLVLAVESPIGGNLVVNGDAETDPGEDSQGSWKTITGWNAVPGMMAVRYSGTSLKEEDPLPPNRGENLFAVYDATDYTMFQKIDVTQIKDRVDAGAVNYQLSAYLGGLWDAPDQAKVEVSFVDANGRELGKAVVGPVTLEDRGGVSGFVKRSGDGPVPAGTRMLRLALVIKHLGELFANNYAYADNIALVLTSGASPISLNRIANAASFATGAVAAGEMVTLSISGISLESTIRMQLDSNGRVKNELGGVKVYFDNTPAALLSVSSPQIQAIVPFDVDGKQATQVRVEYLGARSNVVSNPVAKTAPGVFTQEGTATGRGLIYSDTWTLNSAANPAAKGGLVTILWTGGGQTNPAGADGRMETQSLPRIAGVTVAIGNQPAEVVYAGAVPYSWAGLLMVQAKVPAAAAAGDAAPVTVTVGGVTSQAGVTMAVR